MHEVVQALPVVPHESAGLRGVMNRYQRMFLSCLSGVLVLAEIISQARADTDALPLMSPPPLEVVERKTAEWLTSQGVPESNQPELLYRLRGELASDSLNREVMLFHLMEVFASVHPATAEVLQLQSTSRLIDLPAPARSLLLATDLGPFYQANLRLFLGRLLAQNELYEESLEVLSAAEPEEIVDPASYLFYRASCEKTLLKKDTALQTLAQLLKNTSQVPPRYLSVAELMKYELEQYEEKSLDEVAGKMSDVRRRLNLNRPGKKTQVVEDEIVALLDEMIKKAEEQASQSSASQSNGQSGQSESRPAEESRVKGSTAPGEVDKKNLKPGGNWGNLDDKARAKAKNLISRDFPAHYRQAVEEYFKKLANREGRQP